MKLSLIYHSYKNTNNLKKSLDSIKNQVDKNFEFILISDGITKEVSNILNKYNILSFCKSVKFIFFSENQGHSFSFNEALRQCKNDYVYYFGSNVVLDKNFTKSINSVIKDNQGVDVISITHVVDKKPLISKFHSLKGDLKFNITPSLRDKIFSRKLLDENNILLNEHGYFPLEFLYKVMTSFKE
jgi:glycosyltransferase involved in cell wall biosynthesis